MRSPARRHGPGRAGRNPALPHALGPRRDAQHRQDQKGHHASANGEKEELLQSNSAEVPAPGREKEAHGGPVHHAKAPPIDEIDDKGQRHGGRQCRQAGQGRGKQEGKQRLAGCRHSSVPSSSNSGVEPLQFGAGVFDAKLPVDYPCLAFVLSDHAAIPFFSSANSPSRRSLKPFQRGARPFRLKTGCCGSYAIS